MRISHALSMLLLAVMSCAPSPDTDPEVELRHEALFTNSGFETGTLNSWTLTTALVATTPGVQQYPVTAESQLGLRAGGTARTNLYTGAPYSLIPPGLSAADSVRYPRFGSWAAVVNETGSSYNANRITQSSVVTTADIDPADGLVHVRFVVLPVLQNPGHSLREQPYYYVTISNTTKGTTLASRFNFSNESGVPWQSNSGGTVVYTDWLLFDLPLARSAVSIGDTLAATVIAGGCAQSGHWGEAIIDSFGSTIPGLVVYGTGPDSVEAGSDIQYTYRVINGGSTTTTGTKLTAYLPAGTTFRSVDTVGVTCTTPTVGTRGTVTCDLGALAAGGTRPVKITVRSDATATGTIRHGWYYSSSNQDQPLTGPSISTNLTTGGTTQYVDLVTTVDDAASSMMWGQHGTWSITVRNNGPSAATGVTITGNAPAQLTAISWTCAGTAGGTCTASGNGALNTTANLPSGASVTYTWSGDIIAGSGTGLVSVTASAAPPANRTESYTLDNGGGDDDTISGSMVSVAVQRAGTGSGQLVSSPSGISCGSGCTSTNASFAVGTQVTLQAIPATGSFFAGWSGGTCSGTAACTFTVAASQTIIGTFSPNTIAITSPSTAKAAVGRAFSYTLTASGTAPISLGATSLPAWLTFDAQTGVLSGTAPSAGTFTVSLSATDLNGTANQVLTITAGAAPTITSSLTFTVAASGTNWTNVVVQASGAATIQYNASNLPGTVYFNSTTGAFNGASGANGVFNIPVVATNQFGSDYKTIAVSVGGTPVITSSLTANATVGVPFSYTLTANNALALNASSLPAWASFNMLTGVISGTPTTAGTFSIGLSASNLVGTSNQTLVLTVDGPAVITSALTATGTSGTAFTYSLTAEGSTPITRSMTGLPAWLTFDSASGVLYGTPPAGGTTSIPMSATNAFGTDNKTLTITIALPPPVPTPPSITSALTASGTTTSAFLYSITASGQTPMTFSAAGLPAWASLDTATGAITGTPSAAGTFNVTIGALNSLGSDSKTLVITIAAPPVITSAASASAITGQAFSYTMTTTGSTPMTLSASGLPAWASFNATTGVISGTPTLDGSTSVLLGATNSVSSDSKTLIITVRTVPAITSALTANAVVGTAFSTTLTASGTAPLTFTTGSLPAWLSFNSSTAVLSGTPTAAGTQNVSIAVSNLAGSDSKTLVITIRERPTITSSLTATAVVGTAFSYTMSATGTSPITFTATGLPAWASFNATTGVISGTPTVDAVTSVTLGATNSVGSDSKTLTITTRTRPTVTSAASATAIVGTAFSYTLTFTGSTPMTLGATGLPAWASFNATTGVISGTPTVEAVTTVTLNATNDVGSDSKTLTITTRTRPTITSALTASGIVGTAFSYTLTFTGSTPMTLSATGLPAWASFNATTGVISGTPTADGTFTVTLGAVNDVGSDSKTLTITTRTRPTITSTLTASGIVGTAFSYTMATTGTAPITLTATGLPAWASFNATTGVISGTPTADGTFTITLGATNAAGSDSKTLTITTRTRPTITSSLTAAGVVGTAFSDTITATGTASITYSATGLPAWASLNTSTGVISGTPTADGTFTVTLGATNAAGSDSKTLTITVRTRPTITSTLTASAIVGTPFSYTIAATGTAPITFSATGLPAWASLNTSTGVISGTPTANGTFTITLGATNAAGADSKTLTITTLTTPVITSALTVSGVVGASFSYTLTASGSTPMTFAATGLPSWATFNSSTGIISGTPDAEGVITVALGASNGAGADSKTLTITVRALPAITSSLTASAIVGTAFSYTLTSTGTAPITLSATALPSWASFNASTGVISGTPTSSGTFAIALGASNAAGSDAKTLTLTVRTAPTITSSASATAVVGTAFSYTIATTGSAPMTLTASGLPSWATFNPSTGEITGTPDVDGVITLTLGASNAAGSTSETLTLTVRALPRLTSPLAMDVVVGDDFTMQLTASGTGPLTFSAGSLPAWMQFNVGTNSLTGRPPSDGAVSVQVQVTNAAGADTQTIVFTARTRPTITNVLVARGIVGRALNFTFTATGTAQITFGATNLPAGLSIAGEFISGVPTVAGSFMVGELATNAAGVATATVIFDIRAEIPAPHIASPIEGASLDVTQLTLSGDAPTSEAGNVVRITDGSTFVCDAVIQSDGTWSCTATFPEGAHTVSAVIVDSRGFVGTELDQQSFTIDLTAPVAPTWTAPTPGSTFSDSRPMLSGTGEPGATVNVTRGGAAVCSAVVNTNGDWTCQPTSPLPEGPVTLVITQRDVAGNESAPAPRSFTIDTMSPVAPQISQPTAGALLSTSSPVITGTAEPRSTVKVMIDGVLVCTVTADAQGRFTCPTTALADGPHTVDVSSVDSAGNQSAHTTREFRIDTSKPASPEITSPGDRVATNSPTITGNAEPGSTVIVTLDGAVLCTTTADAEGHWSCPTSSLTDGTHSLSVVARDSAGHDSEPTTKTFVVETTTGNFTSPTDVRTTDNGSLSGNATPGATVNVYVDGALVGSTTADADGHWAFDLPLMGEGEHTVSIGVNNAAGEEVWRSDAAPFPVTSTKRDFGGGLGCSSTSTSSGPAGVIALLAMVFFSRRKRAARVVAPLAVVLIATSAAAQVQETNFELEQLMLNPSARGGLVVGGADLLNKYDGRVAATFGYQHSPLKYFEDGKQRAILVEHRVTATLTGAFSIFSWLEVGGSIPVVLYQGGTPAMSRTGDLVIASVPTSAALGTPWLQGRVAFLQERNGSPLDLGLTVAMGLPLGSVTGLTRESTVTGQLLMGAGRTLGPVRLAAELGAHLRPAAALSNGELVGSRVLLNLGATTTRGPLRGEVSLRFFAPLTPQPVSAEVLAGIRYAIKDWEIYAIAGPGFGNVPGTPEFRALLGASFGGIKSAQCGGRPGDPAVCPELDFDGDGITNGDDACPLEFAKGTFNGCVAPPVVAPTETISPPPPPAPVIAEPAPVLEPEPVIEKPVPVVAAVTPPQVELKGNTIELKGAVYFDTSKATLQSRSFTLLDEVATLMIAHPELKHVRVGGHTDNRGVAASNLALSAARAKAVVDYLVQYGVAPERLISQGFGQTRPIVPNTTAEGREKNRRVEFVVEQLLLR